MKIYKIQYEVLISLTCRYLIPCQLTDASCCSLECGLERWSEPGDEGAREADPGEHPPARPQAPHQGRKLQLQLNTGRNIL